MVLLVLTILVAPKNTDLLLQLGIMLITSGLLAIAINSKNEFKNQIIKDLSNLIYFTTIFTLTIVVDFFSNEQKIWELILNGNETFKTSYELQIVAIFVIILYPAQLLISLFLGLLNQLFQLLLKFYFRILLRVNPESPLRGTLTLLAIIGVLLN